MRASYHTGFTTRIPPGFVQHSPSDWEITHIRLERGLGCLGCLAEDPVTSKVHSGLELMHFCSYYVLGFIVGDS